MTTFIISVVIITAFYLFIGTAHGQTIYSAHGISIIFPAGFTRPIEMTTPQGVPTVSMTFASPSDILGPDEQDSGTMTIVFFPSPITFQQIIAPTLCQAYNWGNVPINSIVGQKVTVDCNYGISEEQSEQYLINGTILIKYSAGDNFVYGEHYPAFISSLATLTINGTR